MKPVSPLSRNPIAGGPDGDDASDEALMEEFIDGNAKAFEALFSRYARPLHGYLARIAGHGAAEDLTQATFLSVVRARGRFQAGARVRPWLYAVATNAARDFLRRQRPEDLTREGVLPEVADPDAPAPRDVGMEKAVQEALAQLPLAQREAIVLHRFEGMSFAEIAVSLDLSESAVKVRAHRGYEKLRALLKHLHEEQSLS